MSSRRRIEASRRNGARSRGPKTPAGKQRSSQNSTRHGLLAERVVLANESEENFQTLFGQYLEKFQPRDGVEFAMVEEMAASYWRLHRSLAIERRLFDQALENHPEGGDLERLGRAWGELANSNGMHTLQRYQSMLHRMHRRSLHNLLLLRDMEPENKNLPNEPSPTSEQFDPPAAEPQTKPVQAQSARPKPRTATPLQPAEPQSQPLQPSASYTYLDEFKRPDIDR